MEPASSSSRAQTENLVGFASLAAPGSVLRPANLTRSLFHAGCGAVSLLLIHFLPSGGWLIAVAGAFALAAWSMEVSRRMSTRANDTLMRLFGAVAHPHERYRINSSTWYVTALLLLAIFAAPWASAAGVAVLAVADPAAGIMGRRYGRTRLCAGRSLEGSLSFLVVAMVAATAALVWLAPVPISSMTLLLGVALVGAVAGTLTELFSFWADDNLTIPLVVAATVSVASRTLAG